MTRYWATNHRQVWTGVKHKYICDIIKAVDGNTSTVYVGMEQQAATTMISELNKLAKTENSK